MATSKPTITPISDTFTSFKDNVNRISLDLGATGRLNTNVDSDVVAAINELEVAIRGTSNNLVASDLSTMGVAANNLVSAIHELDSDLHGNGGGNAKADLTTAAKDIVSAINEIEAVFDASTYEISAGANQFDVTSGAFNIDASGDISLDADGGDVFVKDNGVTYGSLTNSSGNLVIKSGTSTVMTGSGENATFNNNVTIENALQVDGASNLKGNVTLGDANTDNIVFTGEVNSNIIPNTDDTYHLGSSTQQWKDLYVDGTAYIDDLDVDSAEIGDINITGSTIDANGDLTVKSTTGDVVLDANGADVLLKDAGTQYGTLTNSSGNLIVKSGSTTALTFSGADVTTAGTVTTGGNLIMGGTTISRTGGIIVDASTNITLDADGGIIHLKDGGTQFGRLQNSSGNLVLKTSSNTTVATFGSPGSADVKLSGKLVDSSGLNTTAKDVIAAINEHEADIGNMTLTGLTATDISAGLREVIAEVGVVGSLGTAHKTTTVGAINELHTTIGKDIDSDGLNANLASNNIGLSLFTIDRLMGNLGNFHATDVSDHTSIVNAINAVAADVTQLSGESTALDGRIGSLSNLVAGFTGAERNSVVNALNAVFNSVPQIFDSSGTLLN